MLLARIIIWYVWSVEACARARSPIVFLFYSIFFFGLRFVFVLFVVVLFVFKVSIGVCVRAYDEIGLCRYATSISPITIFDTEYQPEATCEFLLHAKIYTQPIVLTKSLVCISIPCVPIDKKPIKVAANNEINWAHLIEKACCSRARWTHCILQYLYGIEWQ